MDTTVCEEHHPDWEEEGTSETAADKAKVGASGLELVAHEGEMVHANCAQVLQKLKDSQKGTPRTKTRASSFLQQRGKQPAKKLPENERNEVQR
jgi:hypothetical protein